VTKGSEPSVPNEKVKSDARDTELVQINAAAKAARSILEVIAFPPDERTEN
jgi:hypothetical protein